MKLAVLLGSCTGSERQLDFVHAWVHRLVGHVAGYFMDQSNGRVNIEFRVFDWFRLPHTSQQWNDLGFGARPAIKPVVEAGLGADLSPYEYFALVIDKFDALSALVSPLFPNYVHVGAQSLDPALLQHERGHFFGGGHANLDTPAGPAEYDDRFCIMGREDSQYSFIYTPLNRARLNGTVDTTFFESGPGMTSARGPARCRRRDTDHAESKLRRC